MWQACASLLRWVLEAIVHEVFEELRQPDVVVEGVPPALETLDPVVGTDAVRNSDLLVLYGGLLQ